MEQILIAQKQKANGDGHVLYVSDCQLISERVLSQWNLEDKPRSLGKDFVAVSRRVVQRNDAKRFAFDKVILGNVDPDTFTKEQSDFIWKNLESFLDDLEKLQIEDCCNRKGVQNQHEALHQWLKIIPKTTQPSHDLAENKEEKAEQEKGFALVENSLYSTWNLWWTALLAGSLLAVGARVVSDYYTQGEGGKTAGESQTPKKAIANKGDQSLRSPVEKKTGSFFDKLNVVLGDQRKSSQEKFDWIAKHIMQLDYQGLLEEEREKRWPLLRDAFVAELDRLIQCNLKAEFEMKRNDGILENENFDQLIAARDKIWENLKEQEDAWIKLFAKYQNCDELELCFGRFHLRTIEDLRGRTLSWSQKRDLVNVYLFTSGRLKEFEKQFKSQYGLGKIENKLNEINATPLNLKVRIIGKKPTDYAAFWCGEEIEKSNGKIVLKTTVSELEEMSIRGEEVEFCFKLKGGATLVAPEKVPEYWIHASFCTNGKSLTKDGERIELVPNPILVELEKEIDDMVNACYSCLKGNLKVAKNEK